MSTVEWTPAMEAWLQEALSRSKPLTVRQLDTILPLFRKVREQQFSENDGPRNRAPLVQHNSGGRVQMALKPWQKIERVGTPTIKEEEGRPGILMVTVRLAGSHEPEWDNYFKNMIDALEANASIGGWGPSEVVVHSSILEAHLESTIAAIDEAVEDANERYERDVIPEKERVAKERDDARARAEARQAGTGSEGSSAREARAQKHPKLVKPESKVPTDAAVGWHLRNRGATRWQTARE
ncbi:hypothetical protein [Rhodococcus sp. LB1]|uniref:hypothetical protein n=1 Tax=Rhodococcus sp. LB1 TaxID=1807499 RepID=UPI00077A97BF|nr:hypothetical protein [Rhodococcus sp. LB1]KXX59428.1 hypothetical protein AZG88_41300 [Rhodococcus sp. LB1]